MIAKELTDWLNENDIVYEVKGEFPLYIFGYKQKSTTPDGITVYKQPFSIKELDNTWQLDTQYGVSSKSYRANDIEELIANLTEHEILLQVLDEEHKKKLNELDQ